MGGRQKMALVTSRLPNHLNPPPPFQPPGDKRAVNSGGVSSDLATKRHQGHLLAAAHRDAMLNRVSKPPCNLLKIFTKCIFLRLSKSVLNFLQDTVLRVLRNVLVLRNRWLKRCAAVRRARDQTVLTGSGSRRQRLYRRVRATGNSPASIYHQDCVTY